MEIRRAFATDMAEIFDLVDCVFYGEQKIPRELHPIPASKTPQWWCVELDDRVIGTAVLFREEDGWHMGRISVSRELRGRKIGTKLLGFALRDAFSQGIEEVRFEARDTTVHILKKFGAVVIGEPVPFFEGTVTRVILKKEDFSEM